MQRVAEALKAWRERRKERAAVLSEARLEAEAREAVQVMEFGGSLYVCVDGVPVFWEKTLKVPLEEAVVRGRAAYSEWRRMKAKSPL